MGLRLAAFEALQLGGVVEYGPMDGDRWRVRLVVPLQNDALSAAPDGGALDNELSAAPDGGALDAE